MAILNTGQDFASGDQVTSQKLMDIVDLATFDDPSDNTTIQVDTNTKKLKVPDNGITSNELLKDAIDNNNRAVTTDHIKDLNVTTAKIADDAVTSDKLEHINNLNVLGNVSGSVAAPVPVEIKDEDDFVSDSNTALATQQSIKAYIQSYVAQQVVLSDKIVASARISSPGGVVNINKSHGFLDITRQEQGVYRFRFDPAQPQPDDDYIVVATRTDPIPAEGDCVVTNQTQGYFEIKSNFDDDGLNDPAGLNVIVLNYT
jgi:hypothetical protein